jgi:hypothetical protein
MGPEHSPSISQIHHLTHEVNIRLRLQGIPDQQQGIRCKAPRSDE